ncbi:MAG: DUF2927 domain-containing protein [Paracoccaceae bacterium]
MRGAVLGLAIGALAACEPVPPSRVPEPRPERLAPPPPEAEPAPRPPESRALAAYYKRLQTDLRARGLLRTDGGGPDTPYTETDLMRHFERIAFYDEYQRGAGLRPGSDRPGRLKKWTGPVRMDVEFGPSVTPAQRTADENEVRAYAARLARVTGHPISFSPEQANFHVLFLGSQEIGSAADRVRQLVPNVDPEALALFRDLPRGIHCLVLAFSGTPGGTDYARAVAVIRAEHPDLLRSACIHEELAQGLGLANDSPRARPSIFNDDDEFALLTSMDEILLETLYDPRLRAGMRLDEARPILRRILADRFGTM